MALPKTFIINRHQANQPFTYADLDRLQKEYAKKVLAGEPGVVLFSEVAPVITLGRGAQTADACQEEIREANAIPRMNVDRGGLATYHGPGQWVVFVVDRIESLTGETRGVRILTERLLQSAQTVARKMGIQTRVSLESDAGLWCSDGKLASVGVRIVDGVVQHGIALNVFQTRDSFRGLSNPCGLDKPPAFLANYLEYQSFSEQLFLRVRDIWSKSLLDQFDGPLYLSASSQSVVGS
ncbi:MAG: hypothetical protein JNL01_10110 [Bdellovibrionales bacterium]|nr:hypothetical protein [Bdellovibrionales bacterium]